jgi:hypothetical protein
MPVKTTPKLSLSRFLAGPLLAFACLNSSWASVLTVTNLGDAGSGTLRDRLSLANDGDTINFGVTGSITLGSQLTHNRRATELATQSLGDANQRWRIGLSGRRVFVQIQPQCWIQTSLRSQKTAANRGDLL